MALDPLAEEANRRLIERLASAGDRAAALVAGERFAERLRATLAIAPSRETRAVLDALRRPPDAGALGTAGPCSRASTTPRSSGAPKELARLRAAWTDVELHRSAAASC